jgi:uncharacterized membrane protein
MFSRLSVFAGFVLLFASVLGNAQTATCTNWTYFAMPSPGGAIPVNPSGINRWGTVVGTAQNTTTVFGFIRYSNGTFKTYLEPNTIETHLTRRNAQGVTIGWAYTAQGIQGLVLSGSSAARVVYPGPEDTVLLGINYWGTIVGIHSNSTFYFPYDGFKLKNGVFTTLHYPGSLSTNPTSINDKGVIAGWYQNSGYHKYYGFTLTNGVYTTLAHPKAVYGTFLEDINSSGVIVGNYRDGSFAYHGFIYINGIFKDIHASVTGINNAGVTGINGYGYVTGNAVSSGFTAHCQ